MDIRSTTAISFYRSLLDTQSSECISVYDFYKMVVDGRYRVQVEAVREEAKKDKRSLLKKRLPLVTVSGTFAKRENTALIQHSNRIAIDIDQMDNYDINMTDLRDTLGTWKEVEFSSLSASGRGVFCVVLIKNPIEHLAHFLALEQAFKRYDIVIDPSCKNVSRARFMSYDKDATFNVDAIPFTGLLKPQNIPTPYYSGTSTMKWIPDWLENRGFSFTPGNRHTYILQFVGAAHRTGVPVYEVQAELLKYVQEDFPEKEIKSIISNMYSKSDWRR